MNDLFRKILKAGLIVGTFDILSAFIYYFIKTGDNPFNILKYIASAVMGADAFNGDTLVYVSGLVLHYIIALTFTAWFFWLYPSLIYLIKNKIVAGIIYGIFIWAIMNLLVVPLTKISPRPLNTVNAIINCIILIVCIGIPLSFMADKFYKGRQNKKQ